MGFEFFNESYAGGVKEITLGKGDNAVTVGGETCYPFYLFEGEMPHKPKIAMEIWDVEPADWPEAAVAPFKDVVNDPAEWAKKCVDEYGADMVALQLKSTDPNGEDASAEAASATVKRVLDAIDVPLIIWGTANVEKDEEVLKQIAEDHQGANLVIGPVDDKNHKGVGAAAMGYGHTVIASSPIDVNIAKQVNILLENLGVPMDKVVIDPTTGGLGYGLEYTYSVMERLRMAAMQQGDDKLQLPIINNLANEIWKSKEAKQSVNEAPTLGDPERRGVLMEAVGAVVYLLGGSDVLLMRHPEAIRLTKAFIDLAIDGGQANEVAAITKQLDDVVIDYAALAPEPDLTLADKPEKKVASEKKKAPAKKAASAKKAAPKKKAAPAKKKAVAKAVKKEKPKAAVVEEAPDPETQAKADARAKAEAEAKTKAKAEAKTKAEAEAKAKAEAEAKKTAKLEAEADVIRKARAEERRKKYAGQKDAAKKDPAKKPIIPGAASLETMMSWLDRIHRR